MMKFDKFTIKVQEALMSARSLAQSNDNQQIEPVHIVLSLIEQQEGITRPLFQKLGVNLNQIRIEFEKELEKIPKVTGSGATDVVLSRSSSKLFDLAWREAEIMRDQFLSSEHLLLAISQSNTPASKILKKHKITSLKINQILKTIRGSQKADTQDPEGKYNVLQKYTLNLTQQAKAGFQHSS